MIEKMIIVTGDSNVIDISKDEIHFEKVTISSKDLALIKRVKEIFRLYNNTKDSEEFESISHSYKKQNDLNGLITFLESIGERKNTIVKCHWTRSGTLVFDGETESNVNFSYTIEQCLKRRGIFTCPLFIYNILPRKRSDSILAEIIIRERSRKAKKEKEKIK